MSKENEKEQLNAVAGLIDTFGMTDAPVKTTREGSHYEVLIPIGKDHTAHLVMSDEAFAELVEQTNKEVA